MKKKLSKRELLAVHHHPMTAQAQIVGPPQAQRCGLQPDKRRLCEL
jgi:hypothetical protein